MLTEPSKEYIAEPDMWVKLAKDNLSTWMSNWMPAASLEVIGVNLLGAAHMLKPELNDAKFVILPEKLKDTTDVSKYQLQSYWCPEWAREIHTSCLFDPEKLKQVASNLSIILADIYDKGNIIQGSVRCLLTTGRLSKTNLLITLYCVIEQKQEEK